jgi:hypothetical protein
VRTLLLVLWLVAYTLLPLAVAIFALIFASEGFASLRSHPENAVLAAAATLFLVAWPLSAIAGWILLILGKVRMAWLVTVTTAGALLLLWLGGLGLAALAARTGR